jgi:aspartate/methionine/tyrosine aminotransferase
MPIAERTTLIAPFYVMELLEKAKVMEARGESIVHLEVGEPDFPTPQAIKERAARSILENRTLYTHSLGIPELRQQVARFYGDAHGLSIPAERIIIVNGTSGAFLLLFGALLSRGGALAVPDPGYPCYRNFGRLFDASIVSLPVTEEDHFEVTPDHLSDLQGSPDLLVISNPSNPTGTLYDTRRLGALYEALSRLGAPLVVDEIYSGLTYGRRPATALTIADDIIVVDGFSKTFAMTGWRLGWMVVPEALVRPIQKIAQNVYISPPAISQYAALAAPDAAEDVAHMRTVYQQRRDFFVPELIRLGFTVPVFPEGAFYVYAGIERWGIDSMDFAERALEEAKVALTPGYDFGSFRAGSHVRFTYAANLDVLKEGCRRLEAWLKTL